MDDAELQKMTVKELQELRAQVEIAIRAAIRAKRTQQPIPVAPPAKPVDLEQERDAWLSARK